MGSEGCVSHQKLHHLVKETMAHKLSSLSILLVLLLLTFSLVLGENQGPKDVDVNQFEGDKHGRGHGFGHGGHGFGHGGGHGFGHGGGHGFGHGGGHGFGHGGGHGGGHGFGHGGGHGCHYYCRHRCCSAVEYAEFVKMGVEDKYGN